MKIAQQDLSAFEFTIAELYDARVHQDVRAWTEERNSDRVSLHDIQVAWTLHRRVRFFSPIVENSAISYAAREMLSVLTTIHHAELNVDFTFDGQLRVLRALVSDLIGVFGVNDESLLMIDVLHAVLIGPQVYSNVLQHYPVDEHAFCIAFAEDQDAAIARHY